MPKLAVQLVRKAPEGTPMVRIELYSEATPRVHSCGYVDPDSVQLEYDVETVAGALACRQNILYKDRHDPDQIAAAAVKGLKRLKRKGEKTNERIQFRSEDA